jgi:hypothetical protein
LTETIMHRVLIIVASSFALAACSGGSLPSFEMPSLPSFSSTPATSTLEFESEPPGADVRTSTGQTCRTPCALSVPAAELTATFTLTGYQPQTIPVRMAGGEGRDPMTGQVDGPKLTPNPVYAELVMAPPVRRPPPAAPAKPTAKKKPKPAAAAKPKPPTEPMAASPSSPPSSPWPAPQTQQQPPAR